MQMTREACGGYHARTFQRLVLAAACAAVAASCTSTDPEAGAGRGSAAGSGLVVDLSARQPTERRDDSGTAAAADRLVGRSKHLSHADAFTTSAAGRNVEVDMSDAGAPGAYRLNFERAEIRDVVHAVLNETLGLNYSMSTDVSGQITVSSARPLNRNELLSVLENVLAGQGFAMTNGGGVYRIAPSTTGAGTVDLDAAGGAQPGYGVSVVPLRHVSAGMMSQLVSGFVADADGVKVDAARNAMVVRGPGAKREEAVRAILAFDADWMQGQSVSLFEVRRARPEAIVAELSQIFDSAENGAGAGVIQFKPITRLRAVLAVSKNPALIKRAASSLGNTPASDSRRRASRAVG